MGVPCDLSDLAYENVFLAPVGIPACEENVRMNPPQGLLTGGTGVARPLTPAGTDQRPGYNLRQGTPLPRRATDEIGVGQGPG